MKIDLRTPNLRKVAEGTIVITSKGFEFIRLGGENEVWQDLTTGLKWFDTEVEKYTHYKATETFYSDSKRLPTIEEFEEAENHGFREVLPNIGRRWFWSASLGPYYSYYARVFYGNSGSSSYVSRSYGDSVRCVGR